MPSWRARRRIAGGALARRRRAATAGGFARRRPSRSADSSSTTPIRSMPTREVRTAERRVKAWETTYKPLASLAAAAARRRVAAPRLLPGAARRGVARDAARRQSRTRGRRHAVRLAAADRCRRRPSRFEAASNTRPRRSTRSCSIATRRCIHDDPPNGVRLYRFAKPLAPGETLTVRFAGRFEPRGFPNDAFNNDVAVQRLVHEFDVRPELRLSGGQRARRRRHSRSATASSRSRG